MLNLISIWLREVFIQHTIFSNYHDINESVVLSLQESHSLSVIMYALPSLNLQRKQLDELNVCRNSVIRRIFSFKRTTSVKEVLYGFGRLNIKQLMVLRKVKFYRKMWLNRTYCMIFLVFICWIVAWVRIVYCVCFYLWMLLYRQCMTILGSTVCS